jgi:hypothetical protein
MNIGVLSVWDSNGGEMGEATESNHREYAERHGYGCVTGLWPGYDFHWVKTLCCALNLRKFDWIFWIDTDAVFMNPNGRIEDLIDPRYDFLFCTDENGINAGTMLLRNCEWTGRFLQQCWNTRSTFGQHWNPEQTAMAHLLTKYPGYWMSYDSRRFNSNPYNVQPWDFVLHAGGWSNRDRLKLFRERQLI